MSEINEKAILELAAEKGYITANDIKTASNQAAGEPYSPLQFLIGLNLLNDEMVEELHAQLQDVDTFTHAERPDPKDLENETLDEEERNRRLDHASEEKQTAEYRVSTSSDGRTRHFDVSSDLGSNIKLISVEQEFPQNWDRYDYVRFLGEGGMGRVFQAFDPRLKRNVAIKFVRVGDTESEQRFLNEAQAQARVTHENLCEIYEVGEVDGRPYIVMQFVDGLPLNQISHEMGLEQKMMLIRDVADGLHHAHRSGLIHRDIKPSNVMIENTVGGGFKPVVLDFGLARQQAAPGMTVTGAVIGTPHYMPPEQARGETHKLDRRGDVYSLGATMYELLTGRPPFSGLSSVNVLFKVINDEPESLRTLDQQIPEDVETITLKCMEKDAAKRYDSARALAQDINCFLDGEPILARRASIFYRLKKKAAKNKLAVSIATSAFLILTSVLYWSWRQQVESARQARLALQFGQEVQEMEDDLRKVFLVPLHNIRDHLDSLEGRMDSFRLRMADVGKIGQGPGNYALGRAYLALEMYEEARDHLERSWNLNFREPQVGYALGRVMGNLYQRELSKVQRISDRDERATARKEIEELYRKPALEYLESVPRDEMESPEYVQALLAFYEGEYARALQHSEAAYARNVWFYEALQLQGDIYKARGDEARNHGAHENATADYRAAGKLYARASRVGESDPSLHIAQANLTLSMIQMNIYSNQQELEAFFTKGLAACDKALQADSANHHAYISKSSLFLRMAEQYDDPKTSQEYVMAAIESAEKAQALGSTDGDFYSQMGRAYYILATDLVDRGQDPSESYEKSYQAYMHAINTQPTYRNYNRMGSLLASKTFYQNLNGQVSDQTWRESNEYYTLARQANPTKMGAPYNQGVLNYTQGHYELLRGVDPSESIDRAIEAHNFALSINAQTTNIHTALGDTYLLQGEYLLSLRKDPQVAAQKAIRAFEKSIEINGDFSRAHQGLGETYGLLTRSAFYAGGNYKTQEAKALEHLEKSSALAPTSYRPYLVTGENYLFTARLKMLSGTTPMESLRQALANLEKARSLNPNNIVVASNLARTYALVAEYERQKGANPTNSIIKCLSAAEKASQVDPTDHRPYLAKSEAYLTQASYQDTSRDASDLFAKAREALAMTMTHSRSNDVYLSAARERLIYNAWLLKKGSALEADRMEPLNKLLASAPNHEEALLLKSLMLRLDSQQPGAGARAETLAEAKEFADRALDGNPSLKPYYERLLASTNLKES